MEREESRVPSAASPDCAVSDDIAHPALHARERWILLAILIVAFAVRAAYPGAMAVEHFDEGVYASNLYCGHLEPAYEYPDRHLYSPPLWPKVLEWTLILSGDRPGSVMWVNVVVGTLTVAAVWWVGRCWFGIEAGLATATLAALSDVHILYSRTALTDPLLCLFMLIGIYLAWEAYCTARSAVIVAAGLLAALAWWTKYNGWLTLAVTGAGLAAWLLFARHTERPKWAYLAQWLVIVVIAGVCWSPVVFGLADVGGYTVVAENHAGYFGGVGEWGANFVQQFRNLSAMEGWLTIAACGFAMAVMTLPTLHVRGVWRPFAAAAIGVWGAVLLGGGAVAGLLGAYGVGAMVLIRGDAQRRLAGWLLAAWFIGLLVAVPLYRAYPRLTLPWLIAAWLGAGAALQSIHRFAATFASRDDVDSAGDPPTDLSRCHWVRRWIAPALLMLTIGLALLPATVDLRWRWGLTDGVPGWQDRTDLAWISERIVEKIAASIDEQPQSLGEIDAIVYVVGEPGLFYHLASREADAPFGFVTQPVGNLDMLTPGATDARVATFVVMGPHAMRQFPDFDPAAAPLSRVGSFGYRPSLLVRLNQPDGHEAGATWNVRCDRIANR